MPRSRVDLLTFLFVYKTQDGLSFYISFKEEHKKSFGLNYIEISPLFIVKDLTYLSLIFHRHINTGANKRKYSAATDTGFGLQMLATMIGPRLLDLTLITLCISRDYW